MNSQHGVLVIDFGSQVTQLIARRVRALGVYCQIAQPKANLLDGKFYNKMLVSAIIFSGSPCSVYEKDAPIIDVSLLSGEIPLLGICYGQQLISHMLGGKIEPSTTREFGRAMLKLQEPVSPLFDKLNQHENYQVWMSHGDNVVQIPEGFTAIATTDHAPFAAISNEAKKIYGVQFHPEVIHTSIGEQIIENFIFKISAVQKNWDIKSFKNDAVDLIRQQVGDKSVICGLSGGVDSSVAATLIYNAIGGDKLVAIFVDTGFLRKDEGRLVQNLFTEKFPIKLVYVDARTECMTALSGISDPEQKRKTIGAKFVEIFEREAIKVKDAEFLAQGTLYPDVIESTHPNSGHSSTIKSHHNVGGLPANMRLKLLEPLRELFKDEVRALGRQLGLAEEIVDRHPFPGPGLLIRVIGAVDDEKVAILQECDAIYIEEIRKAGLYNEIWQAFAVLLPVKTVGVMGDARSYEYTLALRAVTSTDGMTADYYPFPHNLLATISNRIINSVRGVNRVVYDVTSKPPATIEWE